MTAPATRARSDRASTTHAGLDADDVIEAALVLVERSGGDALTMRKLAAELGVTATTIYWHVGNREELVISLVARLADRLATSEVKGTTAHERVAAAARNIWTNALAHRNVTALASQVGLTTLLELPLEVALLAEIERGGLRGDQARDAMRAISMLIAGFLVGAWRVGAEVPPDCRPGALWATVDDERVSKISLDAMTRSTDLATLFDVTLDSVVEGILATTEQEGAATT